MSAQVTPTRSSPSSSRRQRGQRGVLFVYVRPQCSQVEATARSFRESLAWSLL
jgi:hypothetical protein